MYSVHGIRTHNFGAVSTMLDSLRYNICIYIYALNVIQSNLHFIQLSTFCQHMHSLGIDPMTLALLRY